jgi:hypothetical protein
VRLENDGGRTADVRDQLCYIHWQRSNNAFELFSCGLALCAMANLRPSAESIRITRIKNKCGKNADLGRGPASHPSIQLASQPAKPHANRLRQNEPVGLLMRPVDDSGHQPILKKTMSNKQDTGYFARNWKYA